MKKGEPIGRYGVADVFAPNHYDPRRPRLTSRQMAELATSFRDETTGEQLVGVRHPYDKPNGSGIEIHADPPTDAFAIAAILVNIADGSSSEHSYPVGTPAETPKDLNPRRFRS